MASDVPASRHDQRARWAFWIACGLAAVAGVAPFLLGGSSNRISGVVLPFAVGAIGLAACALLYQRGKLILSLLFVVSGLAIAYGILAALASPVVLAITGTCPPEPAACGPGQERPLTSGEVAALSIVIALGVVAITAGYFGIVALYRRRPALSPPSPPSPTAPPVRRIAPVGAAKPADVPAPPPPAPPTSSDPEPKAAPEPPLELAATEPQLELRAPTAEEMNETPPEAPAAAPKRRPRRRSGPKAPPEAPPAPNSDP